MWGLKGLKQGVSAMLWGGGLVIGVGTSFSAIAQPTLFPVRDAVLLAQRFDCRQVAPSQVPFYSSLPQQRRTPTDYLPRGSRVSLDTTAGAVRSPDGQFYHFVTYPFGASNTVTGYIPVQTQTSNGGFRNSLEQCRRRMW